MDAQTPPNPLIDTQTAQGHGWLPPTSFSFATGWCAVPVQMSELGTLVPSVPLAFARAAPGRFTLVAVTGFADGRNQLVTNDGRWVLQYVPMDLGCYPFRVLPIAQSADAKATYGVGFNHASGLYRAAPDVAAGEQLFFTADSKPQPAFQQMTERLQRTVQQQRFTQRALAALEAAELLVPWQVQPRDGHPEETLPAGLYRVDEAKFNTLTGDVLGTLHQVHAIALAYAQLLSMTRLVVLQRLKDTHLAAAQQSAAQAPSPQPVPDAGMGDTLKFSF